MPGENEMVERVARAIELARCPGREGPYGLYDYSKYEGNARPHKVRDFRNPRSPTWGGTVFSSEGPEEARAEYDRLTREHIARAAIKAMCEPTEAMVEAGWRKMGLPDQMYQEMIDASLAVAPDREG